MKVCNNCGCKITGNVPTCPKCGYIFGAPSPTQQQYFYADNTPKKTCRYCKERIDKKAKVCPNCQKSQGVSCLSVIALFLVIFGIVFLFVRFSDANGSPDKNESGESLSENSPRITYSEFIKIETGMTYQEVTEIIGGNGELLSESESMGYTGHVFSWNGNGIGSTATVYFENGRVSSKAQVGLS